MGRIISIILFLQFYFPVFAQSNESLQLKLEKTFTDAVLDFTIDNLGNSYTILKNNQLKKRNKSGDSIAVFNDIKRNGKLHLIDATNPLKLLLYYKDFGNIIVLDRFLNRRNEINLRQLNIFQANVLCQSYDNNIWIFDELDNTVKKINDQGKIIFTSADFRVLFNNPPLPSYIKDVDGFLYLYDAEKGLYVFDYYGALKNNIQLLHFNNFEVLNKETFVGFKDSVFQVYKSMPFLSKQYKTSINLSSIKKSQFELDILYILNNQQQLSVYRIE